MNLNLIKILVDEQVIDAVVEKDEHFLGGHKVIYENQDGVSSIISIDLVNIVSDEYSGSTRN